MVHLGLCLASWLTLPKTVNSLLSVHMCLPISRCEVDTDVGEGVGSDVKMDVTFNICKSRSSCCSLVQDTSENKQIS